MVCRACSKRSVVILCLDCGCGQRLALHWKQKLTACCTYNPQNVANLRLKVWPVNLGQRFYSKQRLCSTSLLTVWS